MLTLVTGGARSGKSAFAERLARGGRAPVLYVATATVDPTDDEMRARIDEHRRRRPADWRTLEAATELGPAVAAVRPAPSTILVDDLGLVVSNALLAITGGGEPTSATADRLDAAVAAEIEQLEAVRATAGLDVVVVTNEVGLGVVPPTPIGRLFRDALGRANQQLAARADVVYLLVAGIPLRIKPTDSLSTV